MRILVDGRPHVILQTAPACLAFVIAEIDEALDLKGRAIQQIVIDGALWPLDQIAGEIERLAVENVDLLEISTEDIRVLVERSLTEIESVIAELPAACHSLASLLNSDERQSALASYKEFAEVWAELMDRHRQVLTALKFNPAGVRVEGVPLDEWQANAIELVRRGTQLAASSDAPELADLLGYDIASFAEQEAEVIALLRALTSAERPSN